MASKVIHISEAEAARDLHSLLERVRGGAEVVIDAAGDGRPVVMKTIAILEHRTISESIALAEAHARELGHEPRMDPEFAADLEDIISNRRPRETSQSD